jgi:hypothetical protein
MPQLNLTEVDSLEAQVIIDNELDPMSTIAPDTVQVSGLMGHLAMNSPHHLDNRGDAHRELQMEDICCSAHGLSILLVRMIDPMLEIAHANNCRPPPKVTRNTRSFSMLDPKKTRGREMFDGCDRTSPRWNWSNYPTGIETTQVCSICGNISNPLKSYRRSSPGGSND